MIHLGSWVICCMVWILYKNVHVYKISGSCASSKHKKRDDKAQSLRFLGIFNFNANCEYQLSLSRFRRIFLLFWVIFPILLSYSYVVCIFTISLAFSMEIFHCYSCIWIQLFCRMVLSWATEIFTPIQPAGWMFGKMFSTYIIPM